MLWACRQAGRSGSGGDDRRLSEIEKENVRLKSKALRTSRILSEGRKFMDAYLNKSQSMLRKAQAAEERSVLMQKEADEAEKGGASPYGKSGAGSNSSSGGEQ